MRRMAFVPEGRCDRSLARSAWDSATPEEPSRRVRCDSCRCEHRSDDWRDETGRTFVHFDQKYLSD
jgi:hypothetical protein